MLAYDFKLTKQLKIDLQTSTQLEAKFSQR